MRVPHAADKKISRQLAGDAYIRQIVNKQWRRRGVGPQPRSRRHGRLKNCTRLGRADVVQDQVQAGICGIAGSKVVPGATAVHVSVRQAGCVMARILTYKLDQGSAV